MASIPSEFGEGISSLPAVGESAGEPEIEPGLWRQFAEATSPHSFCQSWISLQCRMISGVRSGLVLLGPPDQGPFTPVAVWPDPSHDVRHLGAAAERSLRERRGLLVPRGDSSASEGSGDEASHIAYPLEVGGRIHGVVVLEIEGRRGRQIQGIMRQLHWGSAWLEVMIRRAEVAKTAEMNERLHRVLDLLTSVVEHQGFQGAAMGLVTRLANLLECDRVSLGIRGRGHVRVISISHSADFEKQTDLVRSIGMAMDEALDQGAVVVYPPSADGEAVLTRAHQDLSRHHGSGQICTIPLGEDQKSVGALTLERPPDKPFKPAEVELCETAASLIAPILETKRREDRWSILKVADSLANQLGKLLGPGHLIRKVALIGVAAVAVFFYFAKVDYRVTAPINIEGTVQRMVTAPFNGYIKEALVRPGDVVKEGEPLCILDDRDLILERLKWLTEKEQLTKQYHEALAKHERAQSRIIGAKIDQAEAQLALLEEQLGRTRIVSPFDGVVMSGDLSQSLGAPVERGQVLFTVALLDSYRVISEVDERDIASIRVGQRSELLLPSMTGEVFPFVVEKITPVSTAKEGRNYFRVEGRLEKYSGRLLPGMEGVGKIKVDRRRLIWVWTHQITDWLRLKLWAWWP